MSQDHSRKLAPTTPYERGQYPPTDANLDNLIDNWDRYKDHLIIFLGAGASRGAVNQQGKAFPDAYELRGEIYREFICNAKERDSFNPDQLGTLSLDHTGALAEAKGDPRNLRRFIAEMFKTDQPLWPHAVLPFLRPKAVFTTNYDDLIERGWDASRGDRPAGKLTQVFVNKKINRDHVPLYKPHGSIDYPEIPVKEGGIVVTQFDYFEIINERKEMLEAFMSNFNEHCVLFIGYSFQDMDIASHLYELRKKDPGPRWYAVFPRDDNNVRRMYEEKYRIAQINRRFHDFLADLDTAVNFIDDDDWKFGNLLRLVAEGKVAGPATH
jgi:hypothetical protein